ncbi:Pseudouridine-metabolizing bifunctional protein [Anabarilius grahami]|uniref:Pseudouridine-metabolizing bifunctional protein n=1 Tax=Anabarilius grahami TaxID=495550 RepID=A0A3N0YCG9_ANAGA|nr:Pseudouridine-metabolizing bifunctional protein [Anabarilius grahami]
MLWRFSALLKRCINTSSSRLCKKALDVSADLTELGRTPIAVVSAGVKSILDIGRTLEFLVIWFEPTDADKACKPFLSESWKALSYTSPNLAELCTMNHTLGLPTPTELPRSLEDVLGCVPTLCRPLLEHLHCVVVTLGALGVLVCGEHDAGTVNLQTRKQKRV